MAALTASTITQLSLMATPGTRRPATSSIGTEGGNLLTGGVALYPQLSGAMSSGTQLDGTMRVFPHVSGRIEVN